MVSVGNDNFRGARPSAKNMPPVLGASTMAVLPASPQQASATVQQQNGNNASMSSSSSSNSSQQQQQQLPTQSAQQQHFAAPLGMVNGFHHGYQQQPPMLYQPYANFPGFHHPHHQLVHGGLLPVASQSAYLATAM